MKVYSIIKKKITILIMSSMAFCGCKVDKKSTEINKIVKEWSGKEIIFPQNISCQSLNKDTVCVSPSSTPYKILVYTDSTDCISCKLSLYKWNKLIEEVNKEIKDSVNFQFYFHPKNIDNLLSLFRKDSFNYPSYIDTKNHLNKLNNLPKDNNYQCFLLDRYNKVLLIGNPINNPRIWNLYKKTIKGEKGTTQLNVHSKYTFTSLKIEEPILKPNKLFIDKTTIAKFILKNTGSNALIITNVNASCGCTVPEWSKQPILPNKTTEIVVHITPNKLGYFRKEIIVYCNIEKQFETIVIQGIVKK